MSLSPELKLKLKRKTTWHLTNFTCCNKHISWRRTTGLTMKSVPLTAKRRRCTICSTSAIKVRRSCKIRWDDLYLWRHRSQHLQTAASRPTNTIRNTWSTMICRCLGRLRDGWDSTTKSCFWVLIGMRTLARARPPKTFLRITIITRSKVWHLATLI